MTKRSLTDIEVKDKKVFMRVDFNVPLKDGVITDDNRITQALPSIKYIIEQGGLLILASHLGRPGGEKNLEFSLKAVAEHLATLVDAKVHFSSDCIGEEAESTIEKANL